MCYSARIWADLAAAFSDEPEIKALIDQFDLAQTADLERELFKQRKRLADAERTLLTKTTKSVSETRRIATDKVEWVRQAGGSGGPPWSTKTHASSPVGMPS